MKMIILSAYSPIFLACALLAQLNLWVIPSGWLYQIDEITQIIFSNRALNASAWCAYMYDFA